MGWKPQAAREGGDPEAARKGGGKRPPGWALRPPGRVKEEGAKAGGLGRPPGKQGGRDQHDWGDHWAAGVRGNDQDPRIGETTRHLGFGKQ